MADRYYNNDIKKKLGIDQTRTASEKLLDKVNLTKRNNFLVHTATQKQEGAPKKKVKQAEESTPQSVKQKLLKSIKYPANIAKEIKAVNLLAKCLNDPEFIRVNFCTFEIWFDMLETILNACKDENTPQGTITEVRSLKEALQICLSGIKQNLSRAVKRTIQNYQRAEQNPLQKESQKNTLTKLQQALQRVDVKASKIIELESCYLLLFTDDSFQFVKHFTKLRQTVIEQCTSFQQNEQQQTRLNWKENSWQRLLDTKKYIRQLLFRILQLPVITQLESTRTSIVSFFKELIGIYKSALFADEKQQEKQFLRQYNLFIRKKSNQSAGESSYNIMGKATSQKVNSIQIGDGTDTWIQKQ